MSNQILDKYEQLFSTLKSHLDQLKSLSSLVEIIEKDKSSLEEFYYNEWLDIQENHNGKEYEILHEDSIYNLLQDLHSEKIALLKKIVSNIN